MAVETQFFSENLDYFSQYNWIITNPNFSFLLPHKQQVEMEYSTNNNLNQGFTSFPSSCEFCLPSIACDQPLASLIQKHDYEFEHYLHFQGEKLKEELHQQKGQQMLHLANIYESKTMSLLREKEEELEKLRAKTRLLEDYLKKAETETEVWQSIAKKKEEMVIELNNLLLFAQQNNIINNNNNHHYYDNNYCYNNNNDVNVVNEDDNDAESVCDCETLEKIESKSSSCKWCKNESLSVVLLPCKHLCCCKICEPLLGFCPVCQCVKHGSMEILLS